MTGFDIRKMRGFNLINGNQKRTRAARNNTINHILLFPPNHLATNLQVFKHSYIIHSSSKESDTPSFPAIEGTKEVIINKLTQRPPHYQQWFTCCHIHSECSTLPWWLNKTTQKNKLFPLSPSPSFSSLSSLSPSLPPYPLPNAVFITLCHRYCRGSLVPRPHPSQGKGSGDYWALFLVVQNQQFQVWTSHKMALHQEWTSVVSCKYWT